MASSWNKGKFTVGGSNSKLKGEADHGICATTPGKAGSPHANKARDLGMGVAMPNYGSSPRDGVGGKIKPFTGKMGGVNAGKAKMNNNPLAKAKK